MQGLEMGYLLSSAGVAASTRNLNSQILKSTRQPGGKGDWGFFSGMKSGSAGVFICP
jgi:hypothetical protein